MFLLDTHTFLWANEQASKLSPRAVDVITDPPGQLVLSAVSIYEIEFKAGLGKLDALEAPVIDICRETGIDLIAITPEHMERAGRLPLTHRDPWDRILAAQALAEGLTVITRDEGIGELGAAVLW